MGQAYNPIESVERLEIGQEVTFWRNVGGNMYRQDTGEVEDISDVPRPHAVISFSGDSSPLAVGPEDIESE